MKKEENYIEEESEDKKPYKYCFPDPLAKFMSMVDDRTQMEASMLSVSLLMLGLIIFTVYLVGFTNWGWFSKGMTLFNSLCGLILMFSSLITTFQQYQQLRETQDIVGNFGTEEPFPKQEENKENNTIKTKMKGGLKDI